MNIAFCAQKSECMVNIYKNKPIKKGRHYCRPNLYQLGCTKRVNVVFPYTLSIGILQRWYSTRRTRIW